MAIIRLPRDRDRPCILLAAHAPSRCISETPTNGRPALARVLLPSASVLRNLYGVLRRCSITLPQNFSSRRSSAWAGQSSLYWSRNQLSCCLSGLDMRIGGGPWIWVPLSQGASRQCRGFCADRCQLQPRASIQQAVHSVAHDEDDLGC